MITALLLLSASIQRPASRAPDVRLPGDPEGLGEHPLGAAEVDHRRAGGKRPEVRQGSERQPRGPEVHRNRGAVLSPVHHRGVQRTGRGSSFGILRGIHFSQIIVLFLGSGIPAKLLLS